MMLTLEKARHWYDAADPVHGFDHVERGYRMAEHLAQVEGADLEIVRVAALLHDANSGQLGGNSNRSAHHHDAADFARQVLLAEGWSLERIARVEECILAHRFRDGSKPPHSLEAKILYDADKLDAIGAIGVARALAYSLQTGQPIYREPSARFQATGELENGEAHTAYHEYFFKLVHLRESLHTPTARRIAEQRHLLMVQFFRQLAAEMRGEG